MLEADIKSAEAELLDLHEEAKQQENLVNQYKTEVSHSTGNTLMPCSDSTFP